MDCDTDLFCLRKHLKENGKTPFNPSLEKARQKAEAVLLSRGINKSLSEDLLKRVVHVVHFDTLPCYHQCMVYRQTHARLFTLHPVYWTSCCPRHVNRQQATKVQGDLCDRRGVWLTPYPGLFTPGRETRCPLYRCEKYHPHRGSKLQPSVASLCKYYLIPAAIYKDIRIQ
jgi:hypothetical protein